MAAGFSDLVVGGVIRTTGQSPARRRQSAFHWQRQCRLTCWCALLPGCFRSRSIEVSDASTYAAEGEMLLEGQDAQRSL